MKTLKHISAVVAIIFAAGCNDGIDPINRVEPGPDEKGPTINIIYPGEGGEVRVREDIAPIDIRFEATDDIEVASISITLDGTEIATLTDFLDYRKVVSEYRYETLANGSHTLTVTATDLTDKSASATVSFEKVEPYQPRYDGEIFYMPFDGDYLELVTLTAATRVGNPGFADNAKAGKSYAGASGGYLTIPTAGFLNNEFSASFWYNVNASPDRAGILIIGPPDTNLPATPNNRKNGFRFFREGTANNQTFKLNVGNGTIDSWYDGGAAASLDPATSEWVHLAFTISDTHVAVYINGQVVSQGNPEGIDWTGCDILSIASGEPRFTEWGHFSDQSLIDELRLFNKALTKEEIQAIMDGD